MTMEILDGHKTNWMGLWYNNANNIYSSQPIKLSQIRKFKGTVRILVRKNKFYEKGTNRPNQVMCICDSSVVGTNEVEPEFSLSEDYIKLDDAIRIARNAVMSAVYGESTDDLVVEIESEMKNHANALNYLMWGDE